MIMKPETEGGGGPVGAVACPSCGKAAAVAVLRSYHYKESGLRNLWLHGGVTQTTCASCKQRHVAIENETQLLQTIAVALLESPRRLSGAEMHFLRGAARLSQSWLAAQLRKGRETIAEREAKADPGVSFGEELLFRFVVLEAFVGHLQARGNCFLARDQAKRLLDFRGFFHDFSSRFADGVLARGRLVATMAQERGWQLEPAA